MSLTVAIESKSFAGPHGRRVVLGPLSVALAAGELVVLLGPSGGGKTTLLRIIAGLDASFTGHVAWGDEPPRFGIMFQEPRLLPWRTVRENLLLAAPAGSDPTKADRLLDRLGLLPMSDIWAGHLSLGMARRVAFARALVMQPNILLLDEPFASLDEANAAAARALLLDWRRQAPVATLLITHDPDEAARLADRVLLLAGSPARITEQPMAGPADRRSAEEAAGIASELRRAVKRNNPV